VVGGSSRLSGVDEARLFLAVAAADRSGGAEHPLGRRGASRAGRGRAVSRTNPEALQTVLPRRAPGRVGVIGIPRGWSRVTPLAGRVALTPRPTTGVQSPGPAPALRHADPSSENPNDHRDPGVAASPGDSALGRIAVKSTTLKPARPPPKSGVAVSRPRRSRPCELLTGRPRAHTPSVQTSPARPRGTHRARAA